MAFSKKEVPTEEDINFDELSEDMREHVTDDILFDNTADINDEGDYDGDADYWKEEDSDYNEYADYDYTEEEEYYHEVDRRKLRERIAGYVKDTREHYQTERNRYAEYYADPDDHSLYNEQVERNEKFMKTRIVPIFFILLAVIIIWTLLKIILS